ncbi:hypothetical protein GH714_028912 [Hevea brasiliensis]|uniref:RGS domain-containing protein n=1 Tax=Hevea brasiliensis TaxID=3981 RepID=A0A6A6LMT4_HEVBR|nr:hypothetical protein GH714_028912 [Hevea brasiliensis]
MSINILKFKKRHWWQSCYVWAGYLLLAISFRPLKLHFENIAVWFEGPLGFGLLLCCRITQAYQLYYIFVKRQLPLIRSYIFLPLILLPWLAGAALIHVKKPLNTRCHMGTHWVIPAVCLHTSYVASLVGFTGAIRHIEFRFDELKDLWLGILVSASSIGVWVVAYILNEIHDDISWLQVVSRFFLLITALGIPDSGLLMQRDPAPVIDPNEPLDKLLLNKRFRQSFMAFADSCLAGESVHFYNEVHERGKIPIDDTVRRIYMTRHIIEKYIVAGAATEVNISHRTRQEILTTVDLAHPDLFNNAINEVLQLMKMVGCLSQCNIAIYFNRQYISKFEYISEVAILSLKNLAKDYWTSMFFIKFKEEANMRSNDHDLEQMAGWNFSPRLSSVHGTDDPFHQEHLVKGIDSDTKSQEL